MRCLIDCFRGSILFLGLVLAATGTAQDTLPAQEQADAGSLEPPHQQAEERLEQLEQPLYSPFVERYILDEIRQLRIDMAAQRVELLQQVVDRHVASVDRGVDYATNTITYFFYLIAGVSSILVLVGWTSIREIKERMGTLADEEVRKLVTLYEKRLHAIEKQLTLKTRHIDANREQIERTQEIHSLWLRAGQENMATSKISIYDQILSLKPGDCEALTYKADAVLELGETQWAINLCQQALAQDPNYAHAFYQLACAYTVLHQYDEALSYLRETLHHSDTYRDQILQDPVLKPLHGLPDFKEVMGLRLDNNQHEQ
jgi:tetratricopeptide (TPR) repeat protein